MVITKDINYAKEYNDYWVAADRVGESSSDLECIAAQISRTCGLRKLLDVGSGEGALVGELLKQGVDAYGMDVSSVVVNRSDQRLPGRGAPYRAGLGARLRRRLPHPRSPHRRRPEHSFCRRGCSCGERITGVGVEELRMCQETNRCKGVVVTLAAVQRFEF